MIFGTGMPAGGAFGGSGVFLWGGGAISSLPFEDTSMRHGRVMVVVLVMAVRTRFSRKKIFFFMGFR